MASTAALSCPKIMKRPSALKGAVCGTTSGAAKAKDKENTIILQNKGAKASSISLLEKEEKRDDHGIMIMKPGRGQAGSSVVGENATPTNDASKSESPSSPSRVAAATADAGIKTAWDPLEEVDSALLSALCDARERKALFRLEQVLIDFMKNKSFVSMEVGGAFNSIVLNQNAGSGSNNGETPALSQQGLQDFQYQQQRGLRQTSFQRLILHRLADRFDILREQVNNTNNTGNERGLLDVGGSSNMGQPPSFSPGLIRLVKTNASCIPSHLLIGIDLSLLVNYKNPRARNYGGGDNNVNTAVNSNTYEDSGTRKLSENMASATLEAPSVKISSASSKKSKKKMVIMKRTSSSESGSDIDGKGKGKQKGKSRRKKLEDREKAYEEARARIFGISESSGNENNEGGEDDNAEKGERPSVPQSADLQDNAATPLTSCHSSFSLENDATSPTSTAAVREHIVPSQLISATPSTDHSSPPSPEPQQEGDKEPDSPPTGAASEAVDTSRHPSFSSPAPASVTSGAIFKAVYRNRQQEENDPDFKRRSDVRPAYVPYAANPYGAGYVNPAMGQQPPPQMMAMHVQQQQQQAHQPHFYHGSQPSPQFPTPQDAAAYASNVGSNPPPQWTAAPSRAYYPPPQQQGQQEKHPQAWQPRPTSSQMPPTNGSSPNSGNNYGAQFNAPTNNTMNNPQPKQPTKVVLWGPGALSDGGEPDKAVSRAAEGVPTGGKEDAAVYKPEDFPALG